MRFDFKVVFFSFHFQNKRLLDICAFVHLNKVYWGGWLETFPDIQIAEGGKKTFYLLLLQEAPDSHHDVCTIPCLVCYQVNNNLTVIQCSMAKCRSAALPANTRHNTQALTTIK